MRSSIAAALMLALAACSTDPVKAGSPTDASPSTSTTTTVVTDGGAPDLAQVSALDLAEAAAPDLASACNGVTTSATTAPSTIDTTCFVSTFDDDFRQYDISSGPLDDGQHPNEKWFNGTDECCMSTTDGKATAMYPTPAQADNKPVNPYSLIDGGGLKVSLTQSNDEWFSGIMTTVDGNENGFSQMYGYFEMEVQLPPGTGTWPSFWMLSLPRNQPGGEIDVFEQYGCNPPLDPAVEKIFHFTLHDWAGNTTPLAYTATVPVDMTAGYHRYGVLWNATYMALYFDGALLVTTPTPQAMIGKKYFMLADLGIGSGWDTSQTPSPSEMLIKSVRAYSVPGF